MRNSFALIATLALLAGAGTASAQATLLVPSQYGNIPSAVAAASNGDTILVSPGVWSSFVEYFGKAVTINSTDGPEVTVIESSTFLSPICFIQNEGPGSVLDGFTIRNGTVSNGGGIFCATNVTPVIRNCILRNNVAFNFGGGIFCSTNASPRLENCVFYNNASASGLGGVGYFGNGAQPEFVNCTLVGNLGVTGNPATDTGGLYCDTGSALTLENTILWGNTAMTIFGPGTVTAHHSVIEGGDGMGGPYPGTGNLDVDPMLANVANLDFHPLAASPVIDAGDGAVVGLPALDLQGAPRALGAGPDIGALEFIDIYPGSGLDLELRSGVNAGADLVPVKSAPAGAALFLELDSPGATYVGQIPLVFAQFFATGATPPGHPAGFPEIWVDVSQPVSILFDGNSAPVFGLGLLSPNGLNLGYVVPPTLSGASAHVQGLVFAPNMSNPFFTAANALRVDFP